VKIWKKEIYMKKAKSLFKTSLHILRMALIMTLFVGLATTSYAIIFKSDFKTLQELQQEARELNAEVAADSITLLKNIGNTLPLAKNDNVTVFGVFSDQSGTSSSAGFAYGGQGSGNGSDPLGYVSIHEGLEAAGLKVNPTVKAYYAMSTHGGISYSRAATVPSSATDTSLRGLTTGWTPRNNSYSVGEEIPDGADGISNLETVKSSFAGYNDAAIIVIRRTGSEGGDYSLFNTPGHSDPLDHYYSPDDNELKLIEYADRYFEKVIVLVNSANTMELTKIEDNEKVDAILWIGYPGGSGNLGAGKVIAGEVSPSGRTVDIYTADFKTDPSWANFAGNIQNHLKVEEREMIDMVGTNNWVRKTMLVAVTQEDPWTFNSQGVVTMKPLPLRDIVPTDGTTGTMGYRGRPVVEQYSRITDMNGTLNMPQAVTYSSNSSMANLMDYEEGIYMGYRFYETANHEGYFNGIGEDGGKFNRTEAGYYNRTDGVLYPFGYGLSYSSFTQEIINVSSFEGLALDTTAGSTMTVEVKVTNTGSKAAKEAVQLYVTVPYIKGQIEKSYVSMIAFGKTDLIKPGKSEVVELTFSVQDLASFDWNDANKDGHKGYELDPGNYVFRLQGNSHDEIQNFTMTLADIIHYDKDAVTGADIEPLFSPDDGEWDGTRNDPDYYSTFRNEFVSPESPMILMSRADFAGTFPKAPTPDDLKFSSDAIFIINSQAAYTSFNDITTDPWYMSQAEVPSHWTQASAAEVAARVNGKTAVQLWEMADVPYDDERWDAFINQLTWTEIQTLINNSAQNALASIGRPQSANADGPGAFPNSQNGGSGGGVGTHWIAAANLAATFDVKNAEKVGRLQGEHSLWNGAQGWYGPALQMHRNPASGRNFEYFSQDPLLTGLMGAYQVKGATSTGTIVYMKHLFLNEQETSRYSLFTFADEQTAREVYVRAFEWAIKFGNANSTMSSYPSSGLVHPTANYNLYERLLHDEWGFKGYSITDYFNNDNTFTTANMSTRTNQVPLNNWQTNFGRSMDGVWDEVKNVLVVTMPASTTYNPQNVNAGASRAYKHETTGAPASKLYLSSDEALLDGYIPFVEGDSIDAYTQWAAYRNLAHRLLYTTVNSNVMRNGFVQSPWSGLPSTPSTAITLYTPLNFASSLSVAGDQVLPGFGLSYYLRSGTLPTGLTLNENGTLTGSATAEGVYSFVVGAYLTDTNWVGTGGGNNTFQKHYTVRVEPFLTYSGDTRLVVGQEFTGTFTVNPNFMPLPILTNFNNTFWGAAFAAAASTSTNLNHSAAGLPTGITLQAPSVANGFADPESPNYGKFTITGTPTTPVASKLAYLYFGSGSNNAGTNVRTRYASMIIDFSVAGLYVLDPNYVDSVTNTVNYVPGSRLTLQNITRDGYVFAGWFTDQATTIAVSRFAGTTASTTLYARWIDINDSAAALTELSKQVSQLLSDQYLDETNMLSQVAALQTQINQVLTRLTAVETQATQVPSILASIQLINQSMVALTGSVDAEFFALKDQLIDQFELIDLRFIEAEEALAAAQLELETLIEEGQIESALALSNAITALQTAISTGNADLTATLTQHVTTLTNLINQTNTRIGLAEDRVTDVEEQLDDAEAALAEALLQIAEAEAALADALARITEAEGHIEDLLNPEIPETGCGSAIGARSTLFASFAILLSIGFILFIKKRRFIA
jgi:uncharacterized repeat protein (TIGR02543 family)